MRLLTNIPLTVKFISKVVGVNNETGTYHRYVRKIAEKEIRKSQDIGGEKLSRLDYLKIQWYMATTLYLGELLNELRNGKLSRQEEKSLIYLGALMAVTDLMVDDHRLSREKITKLMTEEAERERKDLSAIEQILLLYYRQLLTVINDDKKKIIHDFSLLQPQVDSQIQLSANREVAEVMEQTKQKGGTALLLASSLLFDITEADKPAFYQLGAFIQFMNDSQDLPKDLKNGITTFVLFQKSYQDIERLLRDEYEKTAALFRDSLFPEKNVYKLLFQLHGLMTGILFKLRQYARITKNVFLPDEIKKKDRSVFKVRLFTPRGIFYYLPRVWLFAPHKSGF